MIEYTNENSKNSVSLDWGSDRKLTQKEIGYLLTELNTLACKYDSFKIELTAREIKWIEENVDCSITMGTSDVDGSVISVIKKMPKERSDAR